MTDTFHTRIPTLSDEELRRYLQHHGKYKLEAVEAAVAELRRRGHEVPDIEWERIRRDLEYRDAPRNGFLVPRGPDFLHDGSHPRWGRIRAITASIVVLGFGSAAIIFRLAASAAAETINLESEDSKKYLRDLEVIGGKANVIASEIRHWIFGLFQGRGLAYTVAWGSIILAVLFWFATTQVRSAKPGDIQDSEDRED